MAQSAVCESRSRAPGFSVNSWRNPDTASGFQLHHRADQRSVGGWLPRRGPSGDQRLDIGEALLAAQPLNEAQAERLPVQVAVEVQQVGLYRRLTVVEAGPHAHVDRSREAGVSAPGPAGVDAVRRQQPSAGNPRFAVGKPRRGPAPRRGHLPPHLVWPSQQFGRLLDRAVIRQQRPDAAAAHRLAVPIVGRRHPQIVARLPPELSQPCRAPLAPTAQGEVGADPQRAQRHTRHDLLHEFGGAQRGGGAVEGQDQHEVEPQRGQQIGAFFGRREIGQGQVRRRTASG